jgi:hypothetical protein
MDGERAFRNALTRNGKTDNPMDFRPGDSHQ